MKADLKIFANTIEESAQKQIDILCSSPLADNSKIRIMPDVHAGTGCTIGTTMTITDKICPNLVGVDIGCGMLAVKFNKKVSDVNLHKLFLQLDTIIKFFIPSGQKIHEYPPIILENIFSRKYERDFSSDIFENLSKSVKNKIDPSYYYLSLGTLGGGNHFIELDVDSNENLWLIIHTGSRKLGLIAANYYQNIAKSNFKDFLDSQRIELIEEIKNGSERFLLNDILKHYNNFSTKALDIVKQNKINDLSYLVDDDMENYIHDTIWIQKYAALNREIIAEIIFYYLNDFEELSYSDLHQLKFEKPMGDNFKRSLSFHTIHNYIDPIKNILRKGSVDASKGKMLVIPMNMQYGTLLCEGLGNPDWNYSAPHGAGRLMSRSEAFKKIDISDYKKSMENIHSISVNENTIDESPMAYKNPEEIIELIKPTCKVIDILKPIYNFKASDEVRFKKN